MSQTKLLLDSIRQADGGRVECTVSTPSGVVRGVIEESFFEDFMGQPKPQLTPVQRQRIVRENAEWFQTEADRQLRMGNRQVVIR